MKKEWKGALIGGIVGGLIGLVGFTKHLLVLSYLLLPLWLPLLFITEGVLGIELEGPCNSLLCEVPFGFFTLVYFGLVGMLIGYIVNKVYLRLRK